MESKKLCVCVYIYIYIYIYRLMWDIPYKHTLDCFIKNKMAPTFFYQKKKNLCWRASPAKSAFGTFHYHHNHNTKRIWYNIFPIFYLKEKWLTLLAKQNFLSQCLLVLKLVLIVGKIWKTFVCAACMSAWDMCHIDIWPHMRYHLVKYILHYYITY